MNCVHVKCPNWLADLMQEAGGIVPFSQFMNWALNENKYGAYASGKLKIGKKGDFVTSPSLGPEFCELLAKQISDWILEIERNSIKNSPISIVDIGPGEGDLAFNLISEFIQSYPNLLSKIEFVLIEINEGMIVRQKKKLKSINNAKIRWSNFSELSNCPVTGVMIAHEILDALPVDRIVWLNKKIYLQAVKLIKESSENYLEFTNISLDNSIKNYLYLVNHHLGLTIPPNNAPNGWTSEIHTSLESWFKLASSSLVNGPLLVIDYALNASRFYQPSRLNGTIISYRNQRAYQDVLAEAGFSDITAHLCIETLNMFAENSNFRFVGERRQGLSLLSLGLSAKLNSIQSSTSNNLEVALNTRENLLRLVDPMCLGEFRWLIYEKTSHNSLSNMSLPLFLLDPQD